MLSIPAWQDLFERSEPDYTGVPLEMRHPYVDVRLLRFMLRVPVMPWCGDKHLLRDAFRCLLPGALLNRPKTPLLVHPDYVKAGLDGLPPVLDSPQLAVYGHLGGDHAERPRSVVSFSIRCRFAAISHWLYSLHEGEPQEHECSTLGIGGRDA